MDRIIPGFVDTLPGSSMVNANKPEVYDNTLDYVEQLAQKRQERKERAEANRGKDFP